MSARRKSLLSSPTPPKMLTHHRSCRLLLLRAKATLWRGGAKAPQKL
jgi:hypothetical protein